jgi:hypothetical protein
MQTPTRHDVVARRAQRKPARRSLAWALFAVVCAMTEARPAVAGDARYVVHVVQFQCGDEPMGTFTYPAGAGNQYSVARLETRWYWARARGDHGAGCTTKGIDGFWY